MKEPSDIDVKSNPTTNHKKKYKIKEQKYYFTVSIN